MTTSERINLLKKMLPPENLIVKSSKLSHSRVVNISVSCSYWGLTRCGCPFGVSICRQSRRSPQILSWAVSDHSMRTRLLLSSSSRDSSLKVQIILYQAYIDPKMCLHLNTYWGHLKHMNEMPNCYECQSDLNFTWRAAQEEVCWAGAWAAVGASSGASGRLWSLLECQHHGYCLSVGQTPSQKFVNSCQKYDDMLLN